MSNANFVKEKEELKQKSLDEVDEEGSADFFAQTQKTAGTKQGSTYKPAGRKSKFSSMMQS